MKYEQILYNVEEGIARISLNRPDKLNALNGDIWKELVDAVDHSIDHPEVNVILLTGEGKAFCAGFDLQNSRSQTEEAVWEQWLVLQEQRKYQMKIWDAPIPVVCSVQGYCLGGGFELASLADLVIASDDAIFGETEIRFSLIPHPNSVWLVGLRHAKEMLMLGEHFSGSEAHRVGFVNRLVSQNELEEESWRIATKLKNMPPETMRLTKRTLNKAVDIQGFREMGDWAWDLFLVSKIMTTKSKEEFNQIVDSKGMKEAFKWLNDRFDN